jgi:ring-1,2-phenylacetyl-CoA epoxidase subunit PaaD
VSTARLTREEVLHILDQVKDPEIPVISVVELGVVRDVAIGPDRVKITITPTYSGCPAIQMMQDDMRAALVARGVEQVEFEVVYAPAWTSDWIPADARERMRGSGIAPPGSVREGRAAEPLAVLTRRPAAPVACPYCGSDETEVRSPFGSTACKALHFCNACRQPFEEFKAT